MSDSRITSPVVKSVTALGAGAGTSAAAEAAKASGFLPTDLAGWMAVAASTLAVLYTMHLLGEWYWKKVVRPWCVRRGWMEKPPGPVFAVDTDGNVTREEP